MIMVQHVPWTGVEAVDISWAGILFFAFLAKECGEDITVEVEIIRKIKHDVHVGKTIFVRRTDCDVHIVRIHIAGIEKVFEHDLGTVSSPLFLC